MIKVSARDSYRLVFTCLLFLFPATALSTPVGAGIAQAVLLVCAMAGSMLAYRRLATLSAPLKTFLLLWLASVLLEILILGVHGFSGSRVHSPLLRLVAMTALVLMIQAKPRTDIFWFGIAAGCIATFGVAVFQRGYLNIDRATGFHNAIHYGNFSLAMGMMALAALIQWRSAAGWFKSMLVVAIVAGVMTSIMSGSRGGWIGLALVFIPLYGLSGNKRQVLVIASTLLAVLALAYSIPESGIQGRLASLRGDLQSYQQGNFDTSVGMRLEMFRASWNVFLGHPLLGVGDHFKFVLDEMARLGSVVPPGHQLNDSHNEVLYALTRGGILGLAQLLLIYFAPMAFFVQTLREEKVNEVMHGNVHASVRDGRRAFATAGIVLVMLTIDFGLTVNVFTRHIGKAFYFVTVAFLVALCEIEANKLKVQSSGAMG